VYEVVEKCSAPRDRNIRSDERIRLTGVQAQKDCPCLLRRLVVWDAENEREIGATDQPGGVGLPMRAGTIFRLSSLTKPIVSATSLAIAMLRRWICSNGRFGTYPGCRFVWRCTPPSP
jgi:hypothetical protein